MTSEFVSPQVFRSLASKSVGKLPVPVNGKWDGEHGNSRFTPSDAMRVSFWANSQRQEMTGAEVKFRMLHEYGVDSVRYDSGEPDFSPYVDQEIGSVDLDMFSADRSSNFHKACELKAVELGCDAADIDHMMRERALTWHECGDRKTLLAMPTYIHAAFSHGGGVAVEKSIEAIRSSLSKRFPNGFVLKKQEGTLHVVKGELDRAIDGMRRVYRQEKRQLSESHRASEKVVDDTRYISTRELAEHRGVSVETARRWCRSGRFPGAEKQTNGRWRIRVDNSDSR